MQQMKVVVTGPFAAGKSAFIGALSEIEVVATEKVISDGAADGKQNTTVAMDFGRITVDDDLILHLFGTPGQRRFDFMWDILSEGMLGCIVMVDSQAPETFSEARAILETFRSYGSFAYVVAANKQDTQEAWSPEDLQIALRIDSEAKVVPCVATQRESAKGVLLELLYAVLERAKDDGPSG